MNSLLFTIFAVLPLALAFPVAEAGPIVPRDTPGNIKVCTGIDYSEPCTTLAVGIAGGYSGTCQHLPEAYVTSVGSAAPEHGAICRLFDEAHADCTGTGLAILSYPGDANLYDGDDAGQNAHYIACTQCTAC